MKEICYISREKIPEMNVGDLLICLVLPIGWVVYRKYTTGLGELNNYRVSQLVDIFEKYEIQRYYTVVGV